MLLPAGITRVFGAQHPIYRTWKGAVNEWANTNQILPTTNKSPVQLRQLWRYHEQDVMRSVYQCAGDGSAASGVGRTHGAAKQDLGAWQGHLHLVCPLPAVQPQHPAHGRSGPAAVYVTSIKT